MLVCIGVYRDGPNIISATQANQACIVYRIRCIEQEIIWDFVLIIIYVGVCCKYL